MSSKDVVKVLHGLDYEHVHTTGDHAIFRKFDKEKGKTVIPVPLHPELAKGTLNSIIKQTGLSRDEFLKFL